jgi:hypothetical protein
MSDIVERLEAIAAVPPESPFSFEILAEAAIEIRRLREELRWIPVTEKLPPHNTYVDFLGADGGGHGSRGISKEDCEKYDLKYNPIPKIYENETGPYIIGKDDRGDWGVTHWRLRPGTEPDFDRFIKENK